MKHRVRVLIADETAVSKDLVGTLTKRGFAVETAGNAHEVLASVRATRFDVALLSTGSPDADGTELLRSLGELDPDMAVIMVTDEASADEASSAVQQGASWCVTRPLDIDQLLERIPTVVERHRLLADKRRMEAAVRNAAREWRTTIDAIADPVCLIGLDGRVMRCNKAMRDLVGKDFEEILGQACSDLVHGASEPIKDCPLLRMQASGHREMLVMQLRGRWFNVVCDPVRDDGGTLVGAVHVMSDITSQKRGEALKDSLYSISEAAHTAESLGELLALTHGVIDRLLPARNFYVALYDAGNEMLSFPYFVDERDEPPAPRPPGRGFTEYVLRTGRPLLATAEVSERLVKEGEAEIVGTPAVEWVGVPLRKSERTMGVLAVQSYRQGLSFGDDAKDILTFVSDQVAMSIDRMRAEEELRESYSKVESALQGIIHAMAVASEIRDPYTAGHQRRVTRLACAVAERLGLPDEQIQGIRMAALIHDIGKAHVPVEILSKPGRLNGLEFGLIKDHPRVGYDVLKTIEFPWPVADIVLQHHERMDGSGYPCGLVGDDTLVEARILAVADVVEAMSSHRPYRPALGVDAALEEIEKHRGALYDDRVVDACLRVFTHEGFTFEDESDADR